MTETYTIKSYLECPGIVNSSLYQGEGINKEEVKVISKGGLDKRIRKIIDKQTEELLKNPELNPIVKIINL